MKPEIKKQIILHLPYLMFVYLFDKVAQAFRLAQGADCRPFRKANEYRAGLFRSL